MDYNQTSFHRAQRESDRRHTNFARCVGARSTVSIALSASLIGAAAADSSRGCGVSIALSASLIGAVETENFLSFLLVCCFHRAQRESDRRRKRTGRLSWCGKCVSIALSASLIGAHMFIRCRRSA